MVFAPPSWLATETPEFPDSVTVGDFVLNSECPYLEPSRRKPPLLCASTGETYTHSQLKERVDLLSRSLCDRLGWTPNEGHPQDKTVAIFSYNALDYMVICWAVHRAGGICLLLSPTSPEPELQSHLSLAKYNTVFTCPPLLAQCRRVLESLGRTDTQRLFVLESGPTADSTSPHGMTTVHELVEAGSRLPPVEPVVLRPGEARERVAYLCATSGTSGKQKLAQITHVNMIANTVQETAFESKTRQGYPETATGFLPFSHSYGLILAHFMIWRGDCIVVSETFEMQKVLGAVAKFKIQRLYVIPPIISALVNNPFLFKMVDLSSVTSVVTGATAFPQDLYHRLQAIQPDWSILPGFGLTECATVVSLTAPDDALPGSCGSLLPLFRARLVDPDGRDLEDFDKPGELLLKSPSIMKGYLGDDAFTKASFTDGWLRTGDLAMFRTSTTGHPHLFIVDRLKDMIKVKGLQVAPIDIESCLKLHPAVADVAVTGVFDRLAGERPQAFIVKSADVTVQQADGDLIKSLSKHVEEHLTEPHWLHSRIAFKEEIPRNQAGKILKYKLKAES